MPSAEYPSVSVGLETGLTVGRRVGEGGMAGRAAQRTVVGKQGYILGR